MSLKSIHFWNSTPFDRLCLVENPYKLELLGFSANLGLSGSVNWGLLNRTQQFRKWRCVLKVNLFMWNNKKGWLLSLLFCREWFWVELSESTFANFTFFWRFCSKYWLAQYVVVRWSCYEIYDSYQKVIFFAWFRLKRLTSV